MLKRRDRGRRRLIKQLALGSGAVAATRLPRSWTAPVVDSVVLPAHAQGSPVLNNFLATQFSGPLCGGVFTNQTTGNPLDFVFDWTGRTPTGDATLTVVADGDVNGDAGNESWTISFNLTPLAPTVGNVNPMDPDAEPATASQMFTIPVVALTGTSATVAAAASAGVSCFIQTAGPNTGVTVENTVTITLAFPATSP